MMRRVYRWTRVDWEQIHSLDGVYMARTDRGATFLDGTGTVLGRAAAGRLLGSGAVKVVGKDLWK